MKRKLSNSEADVSAQDIQILEDRAGKLVASLLLSQGYKKLSGLIEEHTADTLLKGVVVSAEGHLDFSAVESRIAKLPPQWLKLVERFLVQLIEVLEQMVAQVPGETKTVAPIVSVAPEVREMITTIGLGEVLVKGLVQGLETQLVDKDGKTHVVSVTASALQGEDGSVSGLVIVAKDLKEIRLVEEEKVAFLEEARAQLEQTVQKRTKELEKEVTEMERFQKLTVDRELRMVQLKKEIKELKERLGPAGGTVFQEKRKI